VSVIAFWRKKASRREEKLRRELDGLVESLTPTNDATAFLRYRWQEPIVEARAKYSSSRTQFYWLRGVSSVGAVVIPALVNPAVGATEVWRWIGFLLSLAVAITTALEELFRSGERWRLYRRFFDEMRAEGWAYVQGIYEYKKRDPRDAYHTFTTEVERIIDRYGEDYVRDVLVLERKRKTEGQVRSEETTS
jgi:hypothetical protein